jgi:transposase-like protein
MTTPRVFDIRVSRITNLLDEQVQAFRERPREGRYPTLFVDETIVSNSLNGS